MIDETIYAPGVRYNKLLLNFLKIMAAILTSDKHLSERIHSQEKVAVSYFSPLCETCIVLTPQLRKLEQDHAYNDVLFLEINAEENPIAKRSVDFREMPLVTTYHNGEIVQASPVYDIDGITAMIENLDHPHLHNSDDDCCSH